MVDRDFVLSSAGRFPNGYSGPESTAGVFAALYGLIRLSQPEIVVEVGAHVGWSTIWMGLACHDNGKGHVHAYERRAHRASKCEGNVSKAGLSEFVTVRTTNFCWHDDGTVQSDFVFIDSEPKHSYPEAFRKFDFKIGAVCCAHDTNFGAEEFPWFLESEGWDLVDFPQERGLVVAMKRGGRVG